MTLLTFLSIQQQKCSKHIKRKSNLIQELNQWFKPFSVHVKWIYIHGLQMGKANLYKDKVMLFAEGDHKYLKPLSIIFFDWLVELYPIRYVSGLGLWCLMPLSTIFQLYLGIRFYWWRKPETWSKPPTCRKILTNFIT